MLSLGTLAPISDFLDKVLSGIAIAILIAYAAVPMWEYYRERKADQSSGAAVASGDQI